MDKKLRTAWAVVWLTLSLGTRAEEMLRLRPVGGTGSGEIVDGLQATVKPVKESFGPGESILLQWSAANVGELPRTLNFTKGAASHFAFKFEARRDGKELNLPRALDRKDMQFETTPKTLAPGEKVELWLDLRAVDWDQKEWLDVLGAYEVRVTLTRPGGGQGLRGAWTAFQITAAGQAPAKPLDPQVAEQVRTLIQQLGGDDFQKREEAQAKLVELGEPALGPLREALERGDSIEIRQRGRLIVARIEEVLRQRAQAQGLCAECRGLAFTADIGRCEGCAKATPSGSWKFCQACGLQRGVCPACGKSQRPPPPILVPHPRPRPRPEPLPLPPPPPVPGPVEDF